MLGQWDQWLFYRDHRGEWRWSRYANAQLVGKSTEGYHHRSDCEANAARLGSSCRASPSSARRDVWEFYRDQDQRWRWRRQARNGRIVGASHVGFVALADCEANARRFGWQQPAKNDCHEGPVPVDGWRTCGDRSAGRKA